MTAHDKPNTLCKVSGPSGDPKWFINGPASSHLRDEVNHVAFQFRPKYSPRLISIFVIILLYFSTPDLHHPFAPPRPLGLLFLLYILSSSAFKSRWLPKTKARRERRETMMISGEFKDPLGAFEVSKDSNVLHTD